MTAAAACVAWCALTASTTLWAVLRGRRAARTEPPARGSPAVLLLRPCAGDEPSLRRALLSSCVAPRGSAVRALIAREDDAAAACARDACMTLATEGVDARVLVTRADGPNRKADQIARALAAEPAAYAIVVADSDVELTDAAMASLLAPIASGALDATWCPPVEIAPVTLGDRASAAVLDASLHAFALLGALDGGSMVGKTFAVRGNALEAAGGFAALASYLGEDMELARIGARVGMVREPARSIAHGRTWGVVVGRYARWIAVIRAQRPWLLATYPLLVCAGPLQLALACLAGALGEREGAPAVVAVIATRWLVAVAARTSSGRDVRGAARAGWLADITLLAAWCVALVTRGFAWRGVPMRIERGRLVEDPSR